ncbi:LysR family transcriptional regulator [Aquamicrobium sp.]|uniref:LysR family transcriptional regulator n=1 Tax=Aquamicrobium sp. TaxID=1872579 RepID=UPI002583D023|nr:LysR family transcriptional regulator [Aquamicrobium sp.]MCK9554049.1 LysR family transcriptional regulator [Aquamicrobium sp.]
MNASRTLMPDLIVLQSFEAAARHGNFTKAAAELSLTQSAVSRQIKLLEDQLGVALFERIRKRVVLTAAGHQLQPEVRQLLQQAEHMMLRARAASAGKVLTVATLPTFGSRWLMPRLPDFMDRNPGVIVDVASRSQPFDLTAESFDLAIHYGQPIWAHASCTYLCSEMIYPVASPALIGRAGLAAVGDIIGQPLLHLATRPKLWSEWCQRNGLSDEVAYRGSRFDQFSMIIEGALAGMGVALLPKYLIEGELASGTLRLLDDAPMPTDNSYYVVLPDGKRNSTWGQLFQEWLLTQVAGGLS